MNRRNVDTYLDEQFRVVPPGDPSAKYVRRQVVQDGEIVEVALYRLTEKAS